MSERRFQRDPGRPCFVISVAAGLVQAHPRTLRIYEDEGLLAPARTPTNIRLYSENDIRRILWIRRLTQERGVNLAGVKPPIRARRATRDQNPGGALRRQPGPGGRARQPPLRQAKRAQTDTTNHEPPRPRRTSAGYDGASDGRPDRRPG